MIDKGSEKTSVYAWIILSLALFAQFTEALAVNGIPVLYPFIQSNFNLTHAQIGLITASFGVGGVATVVLAGWLIDTFGVKRVMSLTLFILALCLIAFPAASTFIILLALGILVGVAVAPIYPATSRAIMDWMPARIRGLSMSLKQSGTPIAGAVAAAALPTLALLLGWRGAAVLIGVFSLIIASMFLLFYRDVSRGSVSTGRPTLAALFALARNRSLMVTLIWGGVFVGLQLVVISYFILFLVEELQTSAILAGGLLAVAQVSSSVGRILWGAVSDFIFKGRRILIVSVIGLLTAVALFGISILQLGAPAVIIIGLAVVIGASLLSFHGVFTALVGEISEPRQVGITVGAASMLMRVGMITFPPLFGNLVDISGSYHLAWQVTAGVALITTLLFLVLGREPEPW
jgi:MFS family permease